MNKNNKAIDILLLISMIYVAVDLSSMVFAYKVIKFGTIIGIASSLIFPLTYSIMDIVAEVYGYSIAKKIMWIGFICDFIFVILASLISHIPSVDPAQTTSYIQVLGLLPRAMMAQSIGVISGAYVNINLISRWKLITNGRYFWLRSIGSSTLGEAVMLVISVLVALTGIVPFTDMVQLIIYTYLYKVIFAVAAAPFLGLISALLKKHLNGLRRGYESFNPFDIPSKVDFSPNFQR